jgi:hypothetical protein
MKSSSRRLFFVLLAGLCALAPLPATAAQVVPDSPIFQVSPPSPNAYEYPAVAAQGDGFLVIWTSEEPGAGGEGEEAENLSVLARRFSAAGEPLGEAIQINQTPGSDEIERLSVAVDADGTALAVWQGAGDGTVEAGSRVVARRLDATGAPLGPEFEIDPNGEDPQAASLGGGRFVVVWGTPRELFHQRVLGRLIGASGDPESPAFQVNSGQGWISQSDPAVAADSHGRFLVVWARGNRTLGLDLGGRFFRPDGTPEGRDVELVGVRYASKPAVAFTPSGDILVAWTRQGRLVVSFLDRSGELRWSTKVASGLPGQDEEDLALPSLAVSSPDGRSVLAWSRAVAPQAVGQVLSPGGTPRWGEFAFGLKRSNDGKDVAVTFLRDGRLVGVWERPGPGEASRIMGRLFELP